MLTNGNAPTSGLEIKHFKSDAVSHTAIGLDENSIPDPKPLPTDLPPVEPFNPAMLPEAVAYWILDISDRMQVPIDFVGIPAMVALGSVIGRRVGIAPQANTDWVEVPNLWGCIIGRPGALKSPSMKAAMGPLEHLDKLARQAHSEALAGFTVEVEAYKIKKSSAVEEAKKLLKSGTTDLSSVLSVPEPAPPATRRYQVNDTSYEALAEVLAQNPNGTLAFRDELVSLLKYLDREDNAAARGFFLQAWNGTDSYQIDRISREARQVDAMCLSLLGSTQPSRIAEYIGHAVNGGAADDGLIQRFGLLVWPDMNGEWHDADRFPDQEFKKMAYDVFLRLNELDPMQIGAEQPKDHDTKRSAFLRFSPAALEIFAPWRAELEFKVRSGELHPALESHLAKYRGLIPKLALICHLADGHKGPVGVDAINKALMWAKYLESHARRCYGMAINSDIQPAVLILKRIKSGALKDGFRLRDIHRKNWTGLNSRKVIQAGLDLLEDYDWVFSKTENNTGGRHTVSYMINPKALR